MEAGGDAVPAQAAAARDWSELPLDVLASVFAKLDAVDILMGAGLVCHSWLDAAKVPYLWRSIDMTSSNDVVSEKCQSEDIDVLWDIADMAMEAVERSGGQLQVFTGEQFVDDELLNYIGDRAPCLKVLHLISCYLVFNGGFVEAIKKFPLLEELKLSFCCYIDDSATYEAVGKACQNLKSLKIVKTLNWPKYDDDEGHGIATIHGLRYLKIICSDINEKALTAILDNCHHLEFLDLCCCSNITMDDAMRAKYDGIKMTMCPHYGNSIGSDDVNYKSDAFKSYYAENPYWSDHDDPTSFDYLDYGSNCYHSESEDGYD